MEPLSKVFDMFQFFEKILPLAERIDVLDKAGISTLCINVYLLLILNKVLIAQLISVIRFHNR